MAVVKVSGMSCEACEAAVRRAVAQASPGTAVAIDRARGEVTLAGGDLAAAKAAILAAGFGLEG